MQAAEEPLTSDRWSSGHGVLSRGEVLLDATERNARPVTRRLEKVVAHHQRHDFPSLSCSDKSKIATLLARCRLTVQNKQSPGWWLVLVEVTVREVALVL